METVDASVELLESVFWRDGSPAVCVQPLGFKRAVSLKLKCVLIHILSDICLIAHVEFKVLWLKQLIRT